MVRAIDIMLWNDRWIVLGTTPTIISVDGGPAITTPDLDGAESMLDLTIAYALIYPQKINYIEVDDAYYEDNYYYDGFGDTLLDALDGVCKSVHHICIC